LFRTTTTTTTTTTTPAPGRKRRALLEEDYGNSTLGLEFEDWMNDEFPVEVIKQYPLVGKTTTVYGLNNWGYIHDCLMNGTIESPESKRRRIFIQALPLLTPVAHARNGDIPKNCTFQGICKTNKLLVKEYGIYGRPAGNEVTSAISKLLGQFDSNRGEKTLIKTAGLKGRNQMDCEVEYPTCKEIENHDEKPSPFTIGLEDVPKLLLKLEKLAESISSSYIPI
jgi:hypothetical protein